MNLRTLSFLVLLPFFAGANEPMQPVSTDQMDTSAINLRAQQILETPGWKWQHAQTEHFVLHFENGIFAAKVARMAEFFYSYISSDLRGASDRVGGRSHIIIFRSKKDWDLFQSQFGSEGTEWAFSVVEGMTMYLQQAGDLGSSAAVLGHEMTHLVVNRFLSRRLPLWLNEGVAEWYGEFVYSEFKGIKKSKRAQFRHLKTIYPLVDLLSAEKYPATEQIQTFYETAKYLVGFLQLEKSSEQFGAFFNAVASGSDVFTALEKHCGYSDVSSLESEFRRFAK